MVKFVCLVILCLLATTLGLFYMKNAPSGWDLATKCPKVDVLMREISLLRATVKRLSDAAQKPGCDSKTWHNCQRCGAKMPGFCGDSKYAGDSKAIELVASKVAKLELAAQRAAVASAVAHTSNDAAEETADDAAEKTADDAAEETADDAAEQTADESAEETADGAACSCRQSVGSCGDRFFSFGNDCVTRPGTTLTGATATANFSLIPISKEVVPAINFYVKLSSGSYLSYSAVCGAMSIDSWPEAGDNQAFAIRAVDNKVANTGFGWSLEAVGRAKCPDRFVYFDRNCAAGTAHPMLSCSERRNCIWLAETCVMTSATAGLSVSGGGATAKKTTALAVRPKNWFEAWKVKRQASLLLYQMVADLHNLFCGFGVPYWATAGTLLGAERNRGMIPWDDDVDVVIREIDRSRIVSKAFNREAGIYGYKMVRWGPIYRLYHTKSNAEGHGWPFIEVWAAKRMRKVRRLICKNGPGGNIRPVTKHDRYQHKCSWRIYHDVYQSIKLDQNLSRTPIIERSFSTTDELFPLKSIQFGEQTISVPQRAIPYLNRYFQGTSWAEQGKLGNAHSKDKLNNQRHVGSDPASITKCMKPTGPLFRFEWERHNFPTPRANELSLIGDVCQR